MKYIYLILAFVFITSCQKHDCSLKGEVMALDPGLCPCCGGWIIATKKDTSMYFYYGDNSTLNKRAQESLPFEISFSYNELEGACSLYVKEMTCFEIID